MSLSQDHSRRVAILLPDLGGGGAERVMLFLAGELQKRGHRVDLLVAQARGELLDLIPDGVRLVDLRAKRLLATFAPLRRYLSSDRPDAVLAVMWPLTVIAVAAHRVARSRARLILSDHAVLSQGFSSRRTKRIIGLTARAAYPLAAARVTCSRESANDLASLSGLPRECFTVVSNPVALPGLDEVASATWPQGAGPRVLSLGSLKAEKAHDVLLDAFATFRVRHAGARLAIVGEGGLRPALEAQRDRLGLHDSVALPGFSLDPWPWLVSCDLFVLSSDSEALPVVLVEALHAGRTIVSTGEDGGAGELLDRGRFGTMAPRRDPAALADAMVRALEAPSDPAVQRARALAVAGVENVDRFERLLLGQDRALGQDKVLG